MCAIGRVTMTQGMQMLLVCLHKDGGNWVAAMCPGVCPAVPSLGIDAAAREVPAKKTDQRALKEN